MSEKQDFFIINAAQGELGIYDPSCDLLHPELRQESSHYALTETHYFGINVPEADIDGLCYMVYRPNLRVVMGGAMVFQGVKMDMLAAELFDMRNYMGDEVLAQDLTSYKLDSGLAFEVVEPGKAFRLRYDDPKRCNSFDILATAASEPIVWPNRRHLEQTMKNTGQLTLRGKRYEVNGYHVRDRSWEGARLERPEEMPAITWMMGALDETLSFNCTSFDHPDLHPQWEGLFKVAAEEVLKAGWIWKDGEAALLKSARNCVRRNARTLLPESVEVDIVDCRGRRLKLNGTITAASPIFPFAHQRGILCLTRWEMEDGRVFWGEIQDAQYTDFVNKMMPAGTW